MGTDEPGQGRCDAVRRVSGPGPAHDDDRVSLGDLRGRGVAGGGLAVRPTAKGGGQKPRVQACDGDPELVERPFANPDRPACLDVVSRNATASGDDEQLHPRSNISEKARDIEQVSGVVVPRNEDGTDQGTDDLVHTQT